MWLFLQAGNESTTINSNSDNNYEGKAREQIKL